MATQETGQALLRRSSEWLTVALIGLTYATMATLVWNHQLIPWWLFLPVGAYFAAMHSSLQHEVLHGHPTRHRFLNELLVFPTLTFWLPYHSYRENHLQHHNDQHLTCPVQDPESYYLLPDSWAQMTGLKRRLFIANHTLLGRMLLGPAISVCRFWSCELLEIWRGNRRKLKHWMLFAMSCALTASFIAAAGMPLWKYLLLAAYPGVSLALVRSYCEHQAAEDIGERTISVEASPLWSLLFLNNNLHIAHHTVPSLAWYRLPAYYKAEREALMRKNKSYLMRGYGEIFRRFLVKPKEPIPHPNISWLMRKQP